MHTYSVSEVAKMLGISKQAVTRLVTHGRLQGKQQPDGTWRLPADQFGASSQELLRFARVVENITRRFPGPPPDDFE